MPHNKSILDYFKFFVRTIRGKEKNITSGNINKAIFVLAIPMIIEMMMESIFAIVDIFFVSKIGNDAVAAVGFTESVIVILFAIALGLSMSVMAMVSRRVGEKKPEQAGSIVFQGMVIMFVVSVVFAIVGVSYAEEILALMGASSEVISKGSGFTRILLGCNLIIMLLFLFNSALRGAGDAHLALRTLILANGLNIFLDPMLIFGIGFFPELGLKGAAIATTIGRSIGVLYQIFVLSNGKNTITILKKHLKIEWPIIKNIIRISLGGVGQYMIGTLSWMFLMRISAEFGSQVVAGYTISIRIIMFTILPAWGMASAAATLVGQNLGAKEPERAEKSVWRTAHFCMVYLGIISVFFLLFGEHFITLFRTDPKVVAIGAMSLRYIGVGYVFFAYGMVIGMAFNGAGDTRTPTIINFFSYWVLQLPLSYFLAIHLEIGPKGMFIAVALAIVVLATANIIFFKKGKWKKVEV